MGTVIEEVPGISHNPLRAPNLRPVEGDGCGAGFRPAEEGIKGRKGKGNGPSARGEGGAGLWPVEVLRLISGHGH